jgi:hypothetical protein
MNQTNGCNGSCPVFQCRPADGGLAGGEIEPRQHRPGDDRPGAGHCDANAMRLGKRLQPSWLSYLLAPLGGIGFSLLVCAVLVAVARRAAYPQAPMKPCRKGQR